MKVKFSGKYDKIFENTICRYQQGGITFGDIVKFKKDALNSEKIKGLSENYKDMIKNAIATDLNLRVGAVKSQRPSSTMNFDTYGTDAAGDYYVDVVVEYAPGLWRDPITVPMEVLEYVDLGANLAPVPDSLKRKSEETKPAEVIASDAERKNPTKNTKLSNAKEPSDGRKQAPKPKVYKESALEDVYGQLLTENITGENIGEGDEVFYVDDDGQEYYARVDASHPTGYTITITGQSGGKPNARFRPGQELQVALGEIQKMNSIDNPTIKKPGVKIPPVAQPGDPEFYDELGDDGMDYGRR